MKPRFGRFLGIGLLALGIVGLTVTSLNTGEGGFLADPGYYPPRPSGPPWGQEFGPYMPPEGWQDPAEFFDPNNPGPQGPTGSEDYMPPVPGPYWQGREQPPTDQGEQTFETNGESIYHTLVTLQGDPILAQARNMGRGRADLSCSGCHGESGQGGYLEMGRYSRVVPAIDNETLRSDIGGGELLRPAYTDQTLGKAITDGVNSANKNLDYSMPRYQLKGSNLTDLITYLKTL